MAHCFFLRSAPFHQDVNVRSVAARSYRSQICCACSRRLHHQPMLGAHSATLQYQHEHADYQPLTPSCNRPLRLHPGILRVSLFVLGVRRETRQGAWALARRAMAAAACTATSAAATAAPATATTRAARATPTRHHAARHVQQYDTDRSLHDLACSSVACATRPAAWCSCTHLLCNPSDALPANQGFNSRPNT